MKRLIFFVCVAALYSSSIAGDARSNVLSSTSGTFVMGSIETGVGSGASRELYMLDTSNGQVWFHGCIGADQGGKCNRWGFRPVGISDGAGGRVFDNAEAWSYANDLGKMLRESKGAPAKK